MPLTRVGRLDRPDRLLGCRSVVVYKNSAGYFIKPDGAHEKLHGAMRWTTTSGVRMRGRSVYTEPRAHAQPGYGDIEDYMSDGGQEDDEEARQLEEAIQRSLQDVGPAAMPDAADAAPAPADPAPAADGEDAGEADGSGGGRTCAVCLTEPAVILMRPCNHICACQGCSRRLGGRPCVICRRAVRTMERVFF